MGFPTLPGSSVLLFAPPPFCRVILIPYLLPPRGLPHAPCPPPPSQRGTLDTGHSFLIQAIDGDVGPCNRTCARTPLVATGS